MVVDKPLTKEEYQQLMNNNLSKSPKKEQPVIENEDDEINLEEIPF
jgi:hypothetical protein